MSTNIGVNIIYKWSPFHFLMIQYQINVAVVVNRKHWLLHMSYIYSSCYKGHEYCLESLFMYDEKMCMLLV